MRPGNLAARAVEVWSFPLVVPSLSIARFEDALAPDERVRAGRFAFPHLRDAFVVARGALRCVLSRYLGCDPAEVPILYSSAGKPVVESSTGLDFNLTHSGRRAAIAAARHCSIGVDIEQVRSVTDMREIARRYFCREESDAIEALPEDKRLQAFFCCWTRKEAYMKAVGDGLGLPLDTFRVTVDPDAPAKLIHSRGCAEPTGPWTLEDLRLNPGYAAAVAYEDRERAVHVFHVDAQDLLSL